MYHDTPSRTAVVSKCSKNDYCSKNRIQKIPLSCEGNLQPVCPVFFRSLFMHCRLYVRIPFYKTILLHCHVFSCHFFTPDIMHQTSSSCPPSQTWLPRSCASHPPPCSAPEVSEHTYRPLLLLGFSFQAFQIFYISVCPVLCVWVAIPSLVWCPLSLQIWGLPWGPWSPYFWNQKELSTSHLPILSPSSERVSWTFLQGLAPWDSAHWSRDCETQQLVTCC